MRTHPLSSFAFALAVAVAGCGGQLDTDGEGADSIIRWTPPAPAYVEWQFNGCLTPDQRVGLVAALQQIHQSVLPQIYPSVGESICGSDGEERGALFPTTTSEAGRQRALALIGFRAVQRSYAFMITATAFKTVAAAYWSNWDPGLRRFDDNGVLQYNGRYQITGYSFSVPSSSREDTLLHVVDTVTQKSIDLDRATTPYFLGGGAPWGSWNKLAASPSLSNDPLIQTVINAADNYLATPNAPNWFSPVDNTVAYAIAFVRAPSLKGWPLPFDLTYVDGAGNMTFSGGDLIQ